MTYRQTLSIPVTDISINVDDRLSGNIVERQYCPRLATHKSHPVVKTVTSDVVPVFSVGSGLGDKLPPKCRLAPTVKNIGQQRGGEFCEISHFDLSCSQNVQSKQCLPKTRAVNFAVNNINN